MPNSLRTAVIIVVALVWAINFTAPVFAHGYHPATELNVAFMAIMGVLTASYQRDDKKTDEKAERERWERERDEEDERRALRGKHETKDDGPTKSGGDK